MCRKQLGELQKRYIELRAQGAELIVVSADSTEEGRKITKKLALGFPVLSDPDLVAVRAYGVEHTGKKIALPSTFVLARGGRVVFHHVGEYPWDRAKTKDVLDALRP